MGANLGSSEQDSWLNNQYQTNLGRGSDQGGADYWKSQYASGAMSGDQISQALANSGEAQTYKQGQANTGNQSYVNNLYTNTLGRAADQGGLDYWTNQLNSGAMTQQQVQQSIAGSAEKMGNQPQAPQQQATSNPQNDASNRNFISQQYQQIFGRAPDESGLNYWATSMLNGASQNDIINGLKNSPEAQKAQQAKTNPVNPSTQPNTNPYGVTTANPYASSTNGYIQAAQQNALGNLAGAQTATAANRVNQSTPYQNLSYVQTGVDSKGNPIWSANQSLSGNLQPSFDNITRNVAQNSANPFDVSKTQNQLNNTQSPNFAQMGANPNLQTSVDGGGMAGWDRANALLMSRLQPQIDQQNQSFDAKMANQGIAAGTEAYNRARMSMDQGQNDLRTQAQLAGSQVQNQMFNQNLAGGNFTNQALTGQNSMGLQNLGFNNAANQQGFTNSMAGTQLNNQALQNNYQQNLGAYNNPLQQLNAFSTGTNPNYVNSFNQATTGGPDYLGAYSTAQSQAIAEQNAASARQAANTNGLYSLGTAALLGGGGVSGLSNTIGKGLTGLSGLFNTIPKYTGPSFGTNPNFSNSVFDYLSYD